MTFIMLLSEISVFVSSLILEYLIQCLLKSVKVSLKTYKGALQMLTDTCVILNCSATCCIAVKRYDFSLTVNGFC